LKYEDQFTPRHEPIGDRSHIPEETASAQDTPIEEPRESQPRLGAILYEIAETALLALVIWLAVNATTARYVVEGQSMEPNLQTGQYLIVSRLHYLRFGDLFELGEPQRGDIVVFDFPGNPSDDYVKRIIGLPGETVRIDEQGQVFVDDVPLDEPYLNAELVSPYRGRFGQWRVAEDSYFVLGDNRNSSSDSRSWGPLERGYLVGKAWVSYWPPKRWGLIPHYDY
jgi:signal peptidase I